MRGGGRFILQLQCPWGNVKFMVRASPCWGHVALCIVYGDMTCITFSFFRCIDNMLGEWWGADLLPGSAYYMSLCNPIYRYFPINTHGST